MCKVSELAICSTFELLTGKVLGLLSASPNDCEHHTQVCRVFTVPAYGVIKIHRMPYLYRLFSAKEPYD